MNRFAWFGILCIIATLTLGCGSSDGDPPAPDSSDDTTDVDDAEDAETGTPEVDTGDPPPAVCESDSDCNDDLFCNGEETCMPDHLDSGEDGCLTGIAPKGVDPNPIDCQTLSPCDENIDDFVLTNLDDGESCDDGIACTTGDVCDAFGNCSGSADDTQCDNGLFCDGVEACNALFGCIHGTPPTGTDDFPDDCLVPSTCIEATQSFAQGPAAVGTLCNDGVDCTFQDACTGAGTCGGVPNDGFCDDSEYCNGSEVCDPSGGCGAGTAPEAPEDTDLTDCVAPTLCDDETDTFTDAPVDEGSDCDDGNSGTVDQCDDQGTCVSTTILCGANEYVLSNACTPCPVGTSNPAGDDASGNDTACTDIDECAGVDCGGGTCSEADGEATPGQYTCTCSPGYEGGGINTVCTNIDECTTNADNCDANATCTDTVGGFSCDCITGFSGDGITCTQSLFGLAANGVTVLCTDAAVGETGQAGGITYTKRSKEQIEALIVAEDYAPLATTCTSGVTDMALMFMGASSFNEDIGSWDVSNVTDMAGTFRNATSFNQDIGSWDVSNVANMRTMFMSADSFNQDIGAWDVGNVTDMTSLFRDTAFNQDISSWDVSSVANSCQGTCFNSMFREATAFNQDLSGWCVDNIPNLPIKFSLGSALSAENHPVWGTCPTP